MTTKVFKIRPTVQHYDWGKLGNESQVAQLASNAYGINVDNDKPYAELWMGTHSTSPSHLGSESESHTLLSDHLASNPDLIGTRISSHFGKQPGQLPFLFKVLSIAKALSIQTHPDKETAKKLHDAQPHIYKDDNHKPEMAIALTPFRALCGFLPLHEIAHHLSNTPELAALIPPTILSSFLSSLSSTSSTSEPERKTALRDLFAAIMTSSSSLVSSSLSALISRYTSDGITAQSEGVPGLVIQLYAQFPGDIGIWCAFVLNYIELEEGQAIFLGAGEPHAYLSGDAMECMAASDNVIRAGLTPKLRDVPNLISGLTYNAGPGSAHFTIPIRTTFSESSLLYDPPIPEFSVFQTRLDEGVKEGGGGEGGGKVRAIDGPAISIVQKGSGSIGWEGGREDVKRGDVIFVGQGTGVEWKGDVVVYTAFVEVSEGA